MNNCKVISEVITMADMFAPLVAQLKANPKTIVFTEGNDQIGRASVGKEC